MSAGLYIHIPFCERKCIYCDFYSVESTEFRSQFTDVLVKEILKCATPEGRGTLASWSRDRETSVGRCTTPFGCSTPEYDTIFFGGGTPSLLTPNEIEKILNALHKNFSVTPDAEVTMECNPGTVTRESLAAYRSLGVNRVSFGVQSFDEHELKFLGRIHSADASRTSVRDARRAGFDNVSIDLIFALPGQTLARWTHTIDSALELETDHVSAYSLIVEEGTPLAFMVGRGAVTPLDEETDTTMYEITQERFSRAGYEQYEVSNFARAGKRSRHNLHYWMHDPYTSFGPSAHSFDGISHRWANVSSLRSYIGSVNRNELPRSSQETVSREQLLEERIMLGLRATGVDLARFKNDFAVDLPEVAKNEIEYFQSAGLLYFHKNFISLTPRGYALCDGITLKLIEKIAQPSRAGKRMPETNEAFQGLPVNAINGMNIS